MATKFNWKRASAGLYRTTTPAGHDIEITGYYVTAEEADGYSAGMRWIVRSQTNANECFDPADTLWEAKLDAEEFWDATLATQN